MHPLGLAFRGSSPVEDLVSHVVGHPCRHAGFSAASGREGLGQSPAVPKRSNAAFRSGKQANSAREVPVLSKTCLCCKLPVRRQHVVGQPQTSAKYPLGRGVTGLVNVLVNRPVDRRAQVLRIGLRFELDAVLVHDGPSMSFPSSSSPLGRPVLRRGVAGRAEYLGAQALQPVAELTLELPAVVGEHVVRNPERDQPSPVEHAKYFIRSLSAHWCHQLIARCLVHTVQEALVLAVDICQCEQVHAHKVREVAELVVELRRVHRLWLLQPDASRAPVGQGCGNCLV